MDFLAARSSSHPYGAPKFYDYCVNHRDAEVSTTEKQHRHRSDREVNDAIAQYDLGIGELCRFADSPGVEPGQIL